MTLRPEEIETSIRYHATDKLDPILYLPVIIRGFLVVLIRGFSVVT